MSGRTSPGAGSSCPNKTVAFCKPPSTVIPAESPVGSSPLTRMGPNFGGASGSNPTPAAGHQPSLRVGPRLRAEGLMVPPASDAATLRRQVAALQIDLEAHIDGEQRLQSINQQLRERCFHFTHSLWVQMMKLLRFLCQSNDMFQNLVSHTTKNSCRIDSNTYMATILRSQLWGK